MPELLGSPKGPKVPNRASMASALGIVITAWEFYFILGYLDSWARVWRPSAEGCGGHLVFGQLWIFDPQDRRPADQPSVGGVTASLEGFK